MSFKRGYLLIISVFVMLFLVGIVYSIDLCNPLKTSCGCGGEKIRWALSNGSCSPWQPCSVVEKEVFVNCGDDIDNDCDGTKDCADTDCASYSNCIDNDFDGYTILNDCDDTNNVVNPGVTEICNNIDDNCDGFIDKDLTKSCGVDKGVCKKGISSCSRGVWGVCVGEIKSTTEICENSLDDDCDGEVDEGCIKKTEEILTEETKIVTKPTEKIHVEPEPVKKESTQKETVTKPKEATTLCQDKDGDGFGNYCSKGPDCDDTNKKISPSEQEICDGKDNNCNNIIDDGLTRVCGLGVGVCKKGTENCVNGNWQNCNSQKPRKETCGNSLDDDCDGEVDEGCLIVTKPVKENNLEGFLKEEFGNSYEIQKHIENYKKTNQFISINRKSTIVAGKTQMKLEIIPTTKLFNVTIYESIPKSAVDSTDKIKFSVAPIIIKKDPLIVWHFEEIESKKDLSYEVNGEVEDLDKKVESIAYSEGITKKNKSLPSLLLPVLIIPLLGFVMVFFTKFVKKR